MYHIASPEGIFGELEDAWIFFEFNVGILVSRTFLKKSKQTFEETSGEISEEFSEETLGGAAIERFSKGESRQNS